MKIKELGSCYNDNFFLCSGMMMYSTELLSILISSLIAMLVFTCLYFI